MVLARCWRFGIDLLWDGCWAICVELSDARLLASEGLVGTLIDLIEITQVASVIGEGYVAM